MPSGRYQPPRGYLTLAQARERMAISHTRVWMMVKQGVLTAHGDPRDRRVKLVREQDIEHLSRPRAIKRAGQPADGEREGQP